MMRAGGVTTPGGNYSTGTTVAGASGAGAGSSGGSLRDVWRALGFLKSHRRSVVIAYSAWVVANLLDLSIPLQVRDAIDIGIRGNDPDRLLAAVLTALALYVGKSSINWVYTWGFHAFEADAARDLRNAVYRGLQRLSFAFLDRADTGQLIARATSDVEAVQNFLGHGLTGFVGAAGTYIVTLAFASTVSWELTLLSALTVPPMLWVGIALSRRTRPQFAQVQQEYGALTGRLQENIAGVRVVKAFAQEDAESRKYAAGADTLQARSLALARTQAVWNPALVAVGGLGAIVVIVAGGYLADWGLVTIGTVVAFQYYLNKLYGPARRIGFLLGQLARMQASARRIFDLLDVAPDVTSRPGALRLEAIRGEVRFERVRFEFTPGVPVLDDINLVAKPGQVIALVGGTGSGKSALTGLIPRFYDATAGRVLVDGHDVRDLDLGTLRKHVAIVPQEAILFSRSVRENIAFGKPETRPSLVEFAAERAQAHRFITRLPEGYQTMVGERGVTLSGGQRQRASLARAILVEPSILILDDATSSVDMETEHLIEQALGEVMRGRTTFVIAHRLSSVKRADEVIVIEGGRIAERGTHAELIARDGHYRRIYDVQMRDQDEVAARAGVAASADGVSR